MVLSQFASSGNRIYSGDSSCVCGIDSALLERLESILKAVPTNLSCPAPTEDSPTGASESSEIPDSHDDTRPELTGRPQISDSLPAHGQHEQQESDDEKAETKTNHADVMSNSNFHGSAETQQHQIHQQEVSSIPNSKETNAPKRPNENQDGHWVGSISSRPSGTQSTLGSTQTFVSGSSQQESHTKPPLRPSSESEQSESSRDNAVPTNTGFLNGLTISPISSHNLALAKLNQSSQSVNEKDMTNALESTVPNLVSNIFSNIQNLTIQTEQNPDRPQPNTLTSIDGSTVDVHGDSKDEITADGEKLFDIWLDHQLETLNLTAVMASHIRKSAGILFRKIIKQYVERVERMGGKVEQNIQRATQMALNNTQTLIAFLLKNYVYFAAGIMQILGEQVSRVGKQIDSTGDTIAHISLNPFDIISNVMESLPNPTDYSNYFRNFGKQLLGDVVALSNSGSSSATQNSGSQSGSTQQGGGLITKTIGAFTKFGSWLG